MPDSHLLSHTSTKRGRRTPKEIHLDEDHLYDLMFDWPEDRPTKHYIGGGLLALMHSAGTMSIKLKYRYQGKEQQLHLGEFGWDDSDEILEKYQQAKKLLLVGVNPRGVIEAD